MILLATVHWVFVLIILAIPLAPLLWFLTVGREARREEILGAFSSRSIAVYFERFWTSRKELADLAAVAATTFLSGTEQRIAETEEKLRSAFKNLYDRQFPHLPYILSTILLSLIVAVSASLSLQSSLAMIRGGGSAYLPFVGMTLGATGIAALAGAYMWVSSDLILRSRRRDCLPSDIYWSCLRMAIALPLGYAIASIAKEDIGPFIAFAMGAFPIEAIGRMLRRLSNKTLGLDDSGEEVSELVKLTPVDNAIASRFQSEGITTIQLLTSFDPVLLAIRCNLPFDFVMECINEALAWRYLKDALGTLRPAGLRGAYEMVDVVDTLYFTADAALPSEADALVAERNASAAVAAAEADALSQKPAGDALQNAKSALAQAEKTLAAVRFQANMLRLQKENTELLQVLAEKLGWKELQLRAGIEHVAIEAYAKFVYRVWT